MTSSTTLAKPRCQLEDEGAGLSRVVARLRPAGVLKG
jgi:hypothetical protein